MKDFESQVARAAVRLRDGENGSLSVKPNPRRPRRLSWGWIATPAAAVAGIFIGVEIGRMSGASMPVTAQVWDTVVEHRVVYPVAFSRVGAACRSRCCGRGRIVFLRYAREVHPGRRGGLFLALRGRVVMSKCHPVFLSKARENRADGRKEGVDENTRFSRCGVNAG